MQVGPDECAVGRYGSRIGDGVTLPEVSGVQQWLGGVATSIGVRYVDPTGAMRAAVTNSSAGGGRFYSRVDCHWSAAGHAFVAATLAALLTAPK